MIGQPYGQGKGGPGHVPHGDMSEMVDRLLHEGKITPAQAAQFHAWESARPGRTSSKEAFEAWMKSWPNIPGLHLYGPTANYQFQSPTSTPTTAKRPGQPTIGDIFLTSSGQRLKYTTGGWVDATTGKKDPKTLSEKAVVEANNAYGA